MSLAIEILIVAVTIGLLAGIGWNILAGRAFFLAAFRPHGDSVGTTYHRGWLFNLVIGELLCINILLRRLELVPDDWTDVLIVALGVKIAFPQLHAFYVAIRYNLSGKPPLEHV